MSTFEVLSVLLSCLALLVSLVVWSGQRRLQKEANDLQKATAELSKRQYQMLEKQELEPLFARMWRKLHPSLARFTSEVSDWLGRATKCLELSASQRMPVLPRLDFPKYTAVDWRYSPAAEAQLSEVVRLVNSLDAQIAPYNQYRYISSEEFWLHEGLADIGFHENTDRYDVFGGEDEFLEILRRVCTECGVREGQSASTLRASPKYQQELEQSQRDMRETVKALSMHLARLSGISNELDAKLSTTET